MASNDCHASSAGLEVCLRCKKGVKGNEAGTLDWSVICAIIGFTQNVRV